MRKLIYIILIFTGIINAQLTVNSIDDLRVLDDLKLNDVVTVISYYKNGLNGGGKFRVVEERSNYITVNKNTVIRHRYSIKKNDTITLSIRVKKFEGAGFGLFQINGKNTFGLQKGSNKINTGTRNKSFELENLRNIPLNKWIKLKAVYKNNISKKEFKIGHQMRNDDAIDVKEIKVNGISLNEFKKNGKADIQDDDGLIITSKDAILKRMNIVNATPEMFGGSVQKCVESDYKCKLGKLDYYEDIVISRPMVLDGNDANFHGNIIVRSPNVDIENLNIYKGNVLYDSNYDILHCKLDNVSFNNSPKGISIKTNGITTIWGHTSYLTLRDVFFNYCDVGLSIPPADQASRDNHIWVNSIKIINMTSWGTKIVIDNNYANNLHGDIRFQNVESRYTDKEIKVSPIYMIPRIVIPKDEDGNWLDYKYGVKSRLEISYTDYGKRKIITKDIHDSTLIIDKR